MLPSSTLRRLRTERELEPCAVSVDLPSGEPAPRPSRRSPVLRVGVFLVLAIALCSAALTGSLLAWMLAALAAARAAFLGADGLVNQVRDRPFGPDHARRVR